VSERFVVIPSVLTSQSAISRVELLARELKREVRQETLAAAVARFIEAER
jgi:hypothetical protein